MSSGARDDGESAFTASRGKRLTVADHERLPRHLLDIDGERAAARAYDLPLLGCRAKFLLSCAGLGARCGATPTYFPGFKIGRKLVVLPLCGVHHRKLERSSDPEGLAADWAP